MTEVQQEVVAATIANFGCLGISYGKTVDDTSGSFQNSFQEISSNSSFVPAEPALSVVAYDDRRIVVVDVVLPIVNLFIEHLASQDVSKGANRASRARSIGIFSDFQFHFSQSNPTR